MRYIALIIVLFLGANIFAQNEDRFEKANQLYNQEKFQEAIELYKTILDSGEESAALYYNLGNSYYKQSNIGPSIYYYEKALQLAPGDEDILNNLAFAQNSAIDKIDVMPQGFITKFVNSITNLTATDGWAWISIIGVLGFVVLMILYFTAVSSVKKRLFFLTSWVFLFLGVVAVTFAIKQNKDLITTQYAIVFSQESEVKSEPNMRSDEVFKLHEGTKIQITDTVSNWKKIKLADGKIGWIPTSDIKEL
ncbi:MAG: ion channel protein [Aquimarina sp.]|nr:ion channel protein [Aquimarina sp.]